MIKNMKKVIFCIIMICSVLLIQNAVFAAQTLSFKYDGKTVKYSEITYKINVDGKEVKTDFPGIVFNKVTMLPIRVVFEQMGGKVIWSSKTQLMDVTYNGMKLQFKNNAANAKLNEKTIKLSAPVKKINDRLIVPIDFFKQIKGMSIVTDNKAKSINVSSIKPIKTEPNAEPIKTAPTTQALTFQYDGKTVMYSGATYKINIDNKEVKTDFPGIVFNKVTMLPIRVVFEQMGGKVIWSSKTQIMDVTYNGMKLQFKNNDANAKLNGKTIKLGAPVKKINDRLIVPIDFFKNTQELTLVIDNKAMAINISSIVPVKEVISEPSIVPVKEVISEPFIGSVKEVLSETSNGKDLVTIKINNFKGFEVFRLTDPNKIVVDFKNVKTVEEVQTIKTNLSLVSGISISTSNKNSTRVVLDLKGMDSFSVETLKDGCKIIIQKPVNAKTSYVNKYDRVYFSLKGIKLASVNSQITNYFKEEYDIKNNKYTIILPASSSLSLANETFKIDDSLLNTIEILRDKETSNTHIVFNTKKEFKFYTSYNEKLGQTEINLLTPAKDDERLVVIDAGHGGQDPGATNGAVKEKDLNLSIALKLEKLLKAKNVKTFMLRQDDTFVGLYDRPYIANSLNATLFLSIHNNAIDNRNVNGTETLYSPGKAGDKSFTGQKFAKIIQDLLLNNLKTNNRKTIERPGLVVLKYTKMPSALAEIGFVTNSKEVKNLQSEWYQQKTAEALCDAIVKSLQQIELEKKANSVIEPEKVVNADIELENNTNADIELENNTNADVELDKGESSDISTKLE